MKKLLPLLGLLLFATALASQGIGGKGGIGGNGGFGGGASAGAAPAEVQGGKCHGTSTCTVTLSSNTTAGHSLLVGIVEDNSTQIAVSSVVHTGDSITCTATSNSGFNPGTALGGSLPGGLFIYLCPSMTTTGKPVVITLASAASSFNAYVQEYTVITAVDAVPAGNGTSSTTFASNATGTLNFANEVGFGVDNSTQFLTPNGTPFTLPSTCPSPTICQDSNFNAEAMYQAIVSSAASITLAGTQTSGATGLLIATFH